MPVFDEDVPLPPNAEGFYGRTVRKMNENPFIIPGCAAVVYSLYRMFVSLHRGDKAGFQRSQRMRVASQMFAIGAFAAGVMWENYWKDQKKLKDEQQAAPA
ncbi:hypothetical protein SeMB42_g02020 [Synchytrium endobioticum]|uniref:HIG1 domain-containing protein n=1 Tax=Synchytrium endobioticum TaxID=286115 RepID=A0A507DJT2_9FUNG|nr:hypothetical protein SeLEV6574_g02299 [Synchytrium endobioticum]TPX51140.1 hypothetical protein SeMB42_g02020 [Synchytrium endobioticum]